MRVQDILELLQKENVSVSDALLRVKVLLHKLGGGEITEWINCEIDGYPPQALVPPYRRLQGRILANFKLAGGREIRCYPLPLTHLSDAQRCTVSTSVERRPLIKVDYQTTVDGDVGEPVPLERYRALQAPDVKIEMAWLVVDGSELKNVAFQVKSRLISFLLQICDGFGQGISENDPIDGHAKSEITAMFKQSVFNGNPTIVIGDNANIGAISNRVMPHDLDALVSRLKGMGVNSIALKALQEAANTAGADGQEAHFRGRLKGALANWTEKAVSGAFSIGLDKLPQIVEAVRQFSAT